MRSKISDFSPAIMRICTEFVLMVSVHASGERTEKKQITYGGKRTHATEFVVQRTNHHINGTPYSTIILSHNLQMLCAYKRNEAASNLFAQ